MALPTTGALTLSAIQTQFGGANPIGLNEYYAGGAYVAAGTSGTNGAIPSSGAISFFNFYGAPLPVGWYVLLTPSSSNFDGAELNIVRDASNNFYTSGYINNISVLTKFNSSGTILWQVSLQSSGEALRPYGITLDALDNVIVTGQNTWGGGIDTGIILFKYNSSGTLQWQRNFRNTYTTEFYDYGYNVICDSASNIYLAGLTSTRTGGGNRGQFVKYNSSGTLMWQKYTGNNGVMKCLVRNTAGNIWIAGQSYNANSSPQMYLAKFQDNGVIQNSYFYSVQTNSQANSILIDSSSNMYMVGFTSASGSGQNTAVVKVDSSGNILWSSSLRVSGSSSYELFYGSTFDSSGNIYCVGFGVISPDTVGIIAKYNSSGVLQWQRTVRSSAGGVILNHITITSDGANMIISGLANTSQIILYLPITGAGAGTSGTITYAVSSLVEDTNVASLYYGTNTTADSTFTSYNTTFSVVTSPTNTYSKTSI